MQNPFDQFDKPQGQQPLVINGPPRLPSPQTSAQATTDVNQARASNYSPAQAAAELESKRLANEAARQGLDNALSPQAIDFQARQFIMTGQLPALGMGGATTKNKILNRAAEIAGAKNLSPEQAQVAFARYRNRNAALQQQEKTLIGLHGNEEAALSNMQQYVDRSQELSLQTGSPVLNSVTQFAQRHLWSDPTLAAMDTAMGNAGGEIGKVISGTPQGGGVLSDSQRQEAMRMLQGSAPIETKRAILEQLRVDMENRLKGQESVINQGYANLDGGDHPQPVAGAMVPGAQNGQGGGLPPVIGGGPLGGQGGPGSPPNGGPLQTWRDQGQAPNLDAAKGGTRDVFDSAVSQAGEQMIRAGKSADEINAYIGPKGFQPISQQAVVAAQAYLRAHPNFRGIFHATRTVPLTGFKGAMNSFANSAPGAMAGSYINDVTGSHLDNIANAAGGDGQLVNLGLETARQDHPYASFAGDIGSGASLYGVGRKVAGKLAGTAVGRIAAKLPGWTAPVIGDAALGGYIGSGANGEQVFDAKSAGLGAAVAAGTGGVVRGGLGVGARAVSPTGGDMSLLYGQGVKPSLGQRLGGGYGRFEQANASLPFAGGFIRGNRNAALDQAQRGAFNTALSDIGEKLPQGANKGIQAHAYMQQAFSKAFNGARAQMQVVVDQPYAQDVNAFKVRLNDGTLSDAQAKQVWTRIQSAIGSRLRGGQISGDAFSNAANDLSSTARKWAKGPDTSSMADALNEYIDIVDTAAARHSPPEAIQALNNARRGYAKAVVIENASNMNTGGEFTGKQLDIAAKNTSPSVRRRAYLRGDAPMQDYASQMAKLGDSVGNSGTLDRILATGGAGLAFAHPLGLVPSSVSVLSNAPLLREMVNLGLSPNRASLAPVRNYINGRRAYTGSLFGAAAAQSAVGSK